MVAQQNAVVRENKLVCDNKTNNMMMTMKGKRTKRSRPMSPLALTMSSVTTTNEGGSNSTTSEEWLRPPNSAATTTSEEEDMAHCLILLAQGSNQEGNTNNNNNNNNNNDGITYYECKTCNKSFSSFQALGGHRASHKKPKPILTLSEFNKSTTGPSITFSLVNTHLDNNNTTLSLQIPNPLLNTSSIINKVNKVHECGICGAEFSSGQALGGHMRRHRPIGTTHKIPIPLENMTIATNNMIKDERETTPNNFLSLDLNLPAPEDEQQHHQQLLESSSKFVFPSNEKTLVFSASSQLVDCHY